MKKYLFALCALGALACAQEAKNGASIGIGAAVQKDVFCTKDRLSAVPLPQIEAYYEGFYAQGGGRGGSYGAEASYSLPVAQRFSLIPAVTYDVFS